MEARPPLGLTDRERYLFDVRGFLVVPSVLSADEVGAINQALDANAALRTDADDSTEGSGALAGAPRQEYRGILEWPHPWCEPFRGLIAHPKVIPYLDDLLGAGWHLDHRPEVVEARHGAQGHAMHFGHWWNHPGIFYSVRAGQIRNGLVVVEFLLSDQPADQGGFCCIPGTHKANFERPDDISGYLGDTDIVCNPGAKAGDAIIFTEALTHGALPWRNAQTRRVAIYRFAAKTVQYGPGFHNSALPEWVAELSPEQRAALEPAYFYDRQVVTPEGVEQRWDDYDIPAYPFRRD